MPKNKKKIGHRQSVPKEAASEEIVEKSEEKAVQVDPKFSKRKIASNWEKYEKDIELETTEQPADDRDFEYLEKTSNAINFFQLSEEKEWDKSRIQPDQSLFSLNIKQLTAGISCLPFYEVLDIDKALLTPESIDRCDKIAKNNVLRYRRDYPLPNEVDTKIIKPVDIPVVIEEKPVEQMSSNREIDEEEDELEDWLDSVLDN